MKIPLPALVVAAVALPLSLLPAQAQRQPRPRVIPPGAVPAVAPPMVPGQPGRQHNDGEPRDASILSKNHRVRITAKTGDQVTGEVSCLTCWPQIQVDGNLGEKNPPTSFSFSGSLDEKDSGESVLTYRIAIRAPVEMQRNVPASVPGGPSPQPMVSYEYRELSCQGAILMKPGQTYDVYQSGGTTYSLTVTPEPNK